MKRDVMPKSVSLGASRKNKRRACAINSSINCLQKNRNFTNKLHITQQQQQKHHKTIINMRNKQTPQTNCPSFGLSVFQYLLIFKTKTNFKHFQFDKKKNSLPSDGGNNNYDDNAVENGLKKQATSSTTTVMFNYLERLQVFNFW